MDDRKWQLDTGLKPLAKIKGLEQFPFVVWFYYANECCLRFVKSKDCIQIFYNLKTIRFELYFTSK